MYPWHLMLTDLLKNIALKCMDKSKITRKQSKASKHGRENQEEYKAEARRVQSLSPFPFLTSPRAILAFLVSTEPKIIQKAVQIAGTLTDEALRNGSIKKNHEKRGNRREPSKDRNVR
ncbi:hypothetical protein Tco_1390646 [Tanacetum coccineum]